MLPVDVLNDLVRSYMQPGGGGMMPQFLQASFDMLRDSQAQMVENMSAMNPMAQMPGFDAHEGPARGLSEGDDRRSGQRLERRRVHHATG